MKFEILRKKKKLFFNFITDGGNVLLKGSEQYQYIAAVEGKVQAIIDMSCDEINYHHRKTDDDQFYYFEMHEGDSKLVLGVSPQFKTHEERTAAIKMMKDGVCGKTMKELMMEPVKERWYYAHGDVNNTDYACYQSEVDQLFYYEILDENKSPVFTSKSYENRFDCKDSVKSLQGNAKVERHYKLNKAGQDYSFELKDKEGNLVGTSVARADKNSISGIAALISGKRTATIVSEDQLRRQEAERLLAIKQKEEEKRLKEEQRLAAEERKREERRIEEDRRRKEKRIEAEKYRKEKKRLEEEEARRLEEEKRMAAQRRLEKEEKEKERLRLLEEKRVKEREEARLRREARKAEKAEKQSLAASEVTPKKVKKKVEEEEEIVESKSTLEALMPVLIFLGLLLIASIGFFVSNM